GDPRAVALYVLSFLAIFAFSGFESMFARFGLASFPSVFGLKTGIANATSEDVLHAAPVVGRYLAFIGIMSAVVQRGLIRRLVPRCGETRLVIIGPVVFAAAFLVIAAAPMLGLPEDAGWRVVIVGCVLMPLGFGLNGPALTGLVSRSAPSHRQGA